MSWKSLLTCSLMSHSLVAIPSHIHIYEGVPSSQINSAEIARYRNAIIPQATIHIRPEYFAYHLSCIDRKEADRLVEELAIRMVKMRVRDSTRRDVSSEPFQVEIDYEKRNLTKSGHGTFGVLYEGFTLQKICCDFLADNERDLNHLHLVFTNQLCATWDPSNQRYHARVAIFGLPALISTSGLVEAPAKPRDFYLRRQLGEDLQQLKDEYREFFIDYGDSRMVEVVKGYAAQALCYYLTGTPFCGDSNCRLFNAHTQSELLQAQILSHYEYCPKHQSLFNRLKDL